MFFSRVRLIENKKTNQFRLLILVVVALINYALFCRNNEKFDYSSIPIKFVCDKISHHRDKFLTFNFLTIKSSAGLGNQLFEALSLIGMAKSLGRIPFFNSKDRDILDYLSLLSNTVPRVIEDILIVPIEIENSTRFVQTFTCCSYETHPLLNCEQSKFLVIHGAYFQSYKYFENLDVRRLLQPTEQQSNHLQQQLFSEDKDRFKICVHYRRGDFLKDNFHEGTDSKFMENSMEFVNKSLNNHGFFYLFGNDPDWAQQNLQKFNDSIRIMRTASDKAIDDLHFSILFCDAVIITAPSSTFGFWLGYLSKNPKNVYYRDIFETNDQVKYQMSSDDFYPNTWNRLSMSKDGEISRS